MLHSFDKKITKIFDWIDSLNGVRALIRLHDDDSQGMCFEVNTTAGFSFKIYCKQLRYNIHYKRYGVKIKAKPIYDVRCVCEDSAPQEIKDKLNRHFVVPETCAAIATLRWKKKSAINAFLTLVIDQLQSSK